MPLKSMCFDRHSSVSGFAHIALLVVVIAIAAAGYFAYQNYQLRQDGFIPEPTPTPTASEGASPTTGADLPTPSPTQSPATNSHITTHSRSDFAGDRVLTLNIDVPSGWKIDVGDLTPDDIMYLTCEMATLEHASSGGSLTISPVCSSYAASYFPWSEDIEIVKEFGFGFSDDASDKYLVRRAVSSSKYTYHEILASPGGEISENNLSDIFVATHKTYKPHYGMFLKISLEVSGNANVVLSEADEIVSNLYLTE